MKPADIIDYAGGEWAKLTEYDPCPFCGVGCCAVQQGTLQAIAHLAPECPEFHAMDAREFMRAAIEHAKAGAMARKAN